MAKKDEKESASEKAAKLIQQMVADIKKDQAKKEEAKKK